VIPRLPRACEQEVEVFYVLAFQPFPETRTYDVCFIAAIGEVAYVFVSAGSPRRQRSVVGSPKNRGLGQGCRLHGGVGLNTGGGTYIRLGAHLTRIPPTASMGFSRLILSKNPHASILGFPSLFSFCSVFDLNYRGPKRGLLGAPEYVGTGLQYVREYRDDRPTERGTA
jgi:hypothetical protein